jgi:hypothetical protein
MHLTIKYVRTRGEGSCISFWQTGTVTVVTRTRQMVAVNLIIFVLTIFESALLKKRLHHRLL